MNNSCLSRLIPVQADKYGDKVALKYRDYTTATWIPVTWNGFADLVDKTARAFVKLGCVECIDRLRGWSAGEYRYILSE